jgi:hypothetical protein
MPSPRWVQREHRRQAERLQVDPFLERLAAAGALDEAEQIWDSEDAGINPCDSVPVQDLVASVPRP